MTERPETPKPRHGGCFHCRAMPPILISMMIQNPARDLMSIAVCPSCHTEHAT